MRQHLFATTLTTRASASSRATPLAQAEIYTWIDAKGQTQHQQSAATRRARVTKVVHETPQNPIRTTTPRAKPRRSRSWTASRSASISFSTSCRLAARRRRRNRPRSRSSFSCRIRARSVRPSPHRPPPTAATAGRVATAGGIPASRRSSATSSCRRRSGGPFPCRGGRGCAPGGHDGNGMRGWQRRAFHEPLPPYRAPLRGAWLAP